MSLVNKEQNRMILSTSSNVPYLRSPLSMFHCERGCGISSRIPRLQRRPWSSTMLRASSSRSPWRQISPKPCHADHNPDNRMKHSHVAIGIRKGSHGLFRKLKEGFRPGITSPRACNSVTLNVIILTWFELIIFDQRSQSGVLFRPKKAPF